MRPAASGPARKPHTTPNPEWQLPDDQRAAWYVNCVDGPPYRYIGGPVQSEVTYRDYRIVRQEYTGAHDKSETMGFDIQYCYAVLDELDEPMTYRRFWSPWDARNAIDFFLWHRETFTSKYTKVYSPDYDFGQLLCYRRRIPLVYQAVHAILTTCQDARDFGDNPSEAVINRINLLNNAVRGWDFP